jgi:hypothetical protein
MEFQKYRCDCCGEMIEGLPALAYKAPDNYLGLSPKEQTDLAEISEDLCIITYPDQTDYFVRAVLHQKINGFCEPLEYSVWVSLSAKSFADYTENFDNAQHKNQYFGWLCNALPNYGFNFSVKTTVFTREDGQRPIVVPYENEDNPLAEDFYAGISLQEAKDRVKRAFQQ